MALATPSEGRRSRCSTRLGWPSHWREDGEEGDTLPEGWMEDVATDGQSYYFRKDHAWNDDLGATAATC